MAGSSGISDGRPRCPPPVLHAPRRSPLGPSVMVGTSVPPRSFRPVDDLVSRRRAGGVRRSGPASVRPAFRSPMTFDKWLIGRHNRPVRLIRAVRRPCVGRDQRPITDDPLTFAESSSSNPSYRPAAHHLESVVGPVSVHRLAPQAIRPLARRPRQAWRVSVQEDAADDRPAGVAHHLSRGHAQP